MIPPFRESFYLLIIAPFSKPGHGKAKTMTAKRTSANEQSAECNLREKTKASEGCGKCTDLPVFCVFRVFDSRNSVAPERLPKGNASCSLLFEGAFLFLFLPFYFPPSLFSLSLFSEYLFSQPLQPFLSLYSYLPLFQPSTRLMGSCIVLYYNDGGN